MDRKNICRLCLVSKNEIIEFFGDEGIKLDIAKMLVQHFWFQIHQDDNLPIGICRMCLKYVNDFHDFYKNIEIIHRNYYDNLQFNPDIKITNIKSEIADNDSSSFNHLNIEFVEPIVEIKIEHEKIVSDDKVKKKVGIKSVNNKTTKSLAKSARTKTNKNDNRTKSNNTKKIKKEKSPKDMLDVSSMNEGEQQFLFDNANEIKYECDDDSNDTSTDNNDFIENEIEDVKKIKLDINPIRDDDDNRIREFYNLKCEICSSQHSTMLEVKKHFLNEHNCKSGYVLCCKKKLFKRSQLLEHIFWHTNPDEFKCKICNQIYANKYGLTNHMNIHSTPEERKYVCDICGTGFTVRYLLMRHFRKIHLTQKNLEFKCDRCDKIFNKNSKLLGHIRGVHELKNVHICEICAKVYKSKYQCKMHYLDEHVNINKPKIQCNLCGSMLKNEKSLKFHVRRKHLEGPIACKLCGKTVASKNSLQNHMRYVHAERKHKCNICDKGFTKPIRLKEHMASHSGNSYLYTCPYCTTSFNSDANMYAHRKKQHPVEWLEDRQKRLGIIPPNNYGI